jgi:hypothetical protein
LIFGEYNQGEQAVRYDNLYPYVAYEVIIDCSIPVKRHLRNEESNADEGRAS